MFRNIEYIGCGCDRCHTYPMGRRVQGMVFEGPEGYSKPFVMFGGNLVKGTYPINEIGGERQYYLRPED